MMKNKGRKDEKRAALVDNYSLSIGKKFKMTYFGRDVSCLLRIIKDTKEQKNKKLWIVTVNPEFIIEMMKNHFFEERVKRADIRVIDGVGLLWGKEVSKEKSLIKKMWRALTFGVKVLKGEEREELISGADLIDDLCSLAEKERMKVFFLGGWKNRALMSGRNIQKKYQNLVFKSCSGRPDFSDEETIKEINNFRTDILFVAYGMKKQEEWIEANLDKLKVKVVIGVGRSFDYYSGELKRAPEWVRKMGLEWLYSLIKEPKRWRRQLALPKFIGKVLFG